MAGRAIDGGVRADQRKAIVVLADGLDLHVPAQHRVALLAISPELAAMKVGVAIRTLRADVAEYGFGVAINAFHLRVHSSQRVARLVVIEFRHCADGLPARQRVAILAWHRQRTVGAARLLRCRAGSLRGR